MTKLTTKINVHI